MSVKCNVFKTNTSFRTASLLAFALSGFCSTASGAFPNVDSMLIAARPTFGCPASGSEFCQLYTNLDALGPTPNQYVSALQTLVPEANGSLTATSDAAMREIVQVINDRLMKVEQKEKYSGYSGGDASEKASSKKEEKKEAKEEAIDEAASEDNDALANAPSADDTTKENKILNKGVWMQIVGSDIAQDSILEVPGFDAQVLGLVLGRDLLVNPNFTVGLAIGYQHGEVNSRGPSGSFMSNKRFQGSLYAGYRFCCPFYLNAVFTGARNDYDNNRKILVPDVVASSPIVNIAHTDFSSWELDGYLELGYIWQCNHFRAIPKLMLNYSHFGFGSYEEEDAYGLDLHVKYNDINSMPLGAGLRMDYINEFNSVYVVPEIHAYVFYDFMNNTQNVTSWMLGGGYSFLTQGIQPTSTSLEVGGSLNVYSYRNVGINFQYDYTTKTNFHRHSGFIKIRYEWA